MKRKAYLGACLRAHLGACLVACLGACLRGTPLLLLVACGAGKTPTDPDFEAAVVANTYQLLKVQVRALHQAALDLQDAAPLPPDRGWDAALDDAALVSMKNSWIAMRRAWESSEGVLPNLFDSLDKALDSRYEDLLAPPADGSAPAGDADPFDGTGVVGMHAIERILYAPDTPTAVVDWEASQVPGSMPAMWPATAEQAAAFKTGLCEQLVQDCQTLMDSLKSEAINLAIAFEGLTGLMSAQVEKVNLAADHQEESRYSQRTMADLRENLDGTSAIYSEFMDWLATKPGGLAINAEVEQALDMLAQIYSAVNGAAIPEPPPDWDSKLPSTADQQTPFGVLYRAVVQAVDPNRTGSAVDAMNHAARALNLPEFLPPTE